MTLSEGEQAYRQALRYLRSLKGKEQPAEQLASVMSRLTAALDQPHAETIARLLDLATARARSATVATASPGLTATAVLKASVDVGVATDHLRVTKAGAEQVEDVGELVAKAAKHGFRDLSGWQLLTVVLVVLLAVGLPFAQVKLPPDIQSLIGDEEATLGIGLAITLAITQNGKK